MEKNKYLIISIILIILLLSISIVFGIRNIFKDKEKIIISEKITDDCLEELNKSIEKVNEANSSEERITPNSLMILKRYYTECEHTINEYIDIPTDLINLTEIELKEKYPTWEVIGFSSGEVTLYKEIEDTCKEHYILKEKSGKINIYVETDEGEKLYEETDISVEYLTETDLIKIKDGLQVYGKEELNKVLEDFE